MEESVKVKEKKKNNSKSIIIDGKLHADMKHYCMGSKRKIGGVIENLIKLYLSDPKSIENQIDNIKVG